MTGATTIGQYRARGPDATLARMKSWRESDPAAPAGSDAPLSLRHILGAPPADTWWGLHRATLASVTGWVTSLAVVVSAGYLLWAMMYRHATDHDPFLGLPRPRATSTTAPPVGDRPADAADAVKVVRPEPLTVATTASGVEAKSTTVASGGGTGASGGPSGSNSGPGGPASPTTETPRAGGTTTSDDSGGNRGQGGVSTASSTTTTQPTGSASSSSWSSSTTRVTASTSTASTVDDKGGGSGSGGGGGGSGSGSGGGPGKG